MAHTGRVTSVKHLAVPTSSSSQQLEQHLLVSCGADSCVKVWDVTKMLRCCVVQEQINIADKDAAIIDARVVSLQ